MLEKHVCKIINIERYSNVYFSFYNYNNYENQSLIRPAKGFFVL